MYEESLNLNLDYLLKCLLTACHFADVAFPIFIEINVSKILHEYKEYTKLCKNHSIVIFFNSAKMFWMAESTHCFQEMCKTKCHINKIKGGHFLEQ